MPQRYLLLLSALLCAASSASRPLFAAELPDVANYARRIVVQRDLVFPVGHEKKQKLDLYLPAGKGPFPVVICWHGGNFVGGSKADMARICAFLADHGLAAAAANYHLAGGNSPGWPDKVNDAKSAVRFLRKNSGELRLDPDQIAVLGHSAGAYLALMVGFIPQNEKFTVAGDESVPSDHVAAVVNIAGVSDRRAGLGKGTANLLGRGYENNVDLRRSASPVVHIRSNCPPVFTLQGLDDQTVHPDSARQLDAALRSAGVAHRLELIPGAGHNPISVETITPIVAWLRGELKVAGKD
jgi:acetyl esterase/lipase